MFKLKLSDDRFIFGFSKKELLTYATQFLAIFFITFSVLFLLGLVPEELRTAAISNQKQKENVAQVNDSQNNFEIKTENQEQNVVAQNTYTRPDRVVISKIGVDSTIQKPETANVNILDEALKYGAVHYPGSGSVENGNIFLFGHSTNWKVVQNQAYKTFNGLDKLVSGDEITLYSNGKKYVYAVEKISLVDENTAFVDLSKEGRRLTISTCNSFGAKQERWVAEAVLVNSE